MASPILKQTWTVMGVLLNMLAQGMFVSLPSIILPTLTAPDSEISVDLNTTSWFLSVMGMTGILGFISASILMDLYGRRFTHIVVIVPLMACWLCTYFATNIATLIIGRALGGFSAAASVSVGAVIIGEYTSPKDRGMFLNLKTAAIGFGKMTTHILGQFYVWRTVALISLFPTIAALLISFTWPESPSWLASKKRYEKSEKSFYWLRGKGADSIKEIEELLKAQREMFSSRSIKKSLITKVQDFLKKFKRRNFMLPVTVVMISSLLLEASGSNIFPTYAFQIIEEVTGNKAQSFYYTILIDIIVTVSASFSSVLIKYFKRRFLLFSTGFISVLVLYAACLYLFLVSKNIISNESNFIPIILFCIFFILTNSGCTTLTGVLLGEIFPLVHRAIGACISGVFFSITVMGSMRVTPYLLFTIKVYGTFTVLATIMLVTLIILWFIFPETKDKTLQEIEDSMTKGRYRSIPKNEVIEGKL